MMSCNYKYVAQHRSLSQSEFQHYFLAIWVESNLLLLLRFYLRHCRNAKLLPAVTLNVGIETNSFAAQLPNKNVIAFVTSLTENGAEH